MSKFKVARNMNLKEVRTENFGLGIQEVKAQDKRMHLITQKNVEWEGKGKGRTLENTNIPRHVIQKTATESLKGRRRRMMIQI